MPFYKEGEILWIVLLVTLGLDPYTFWERIGEQRELMKNISDLTQPQAEVLILEPPLICSLSHSSHTHPHTPTSKQPATQCLNL